MNPKRPSRAHAIERLHAAYRNGTRISPRLAALARLPFPADEDRADAVRAFGGLAVLAELISERHPERFAELIYTAEAALFYAEEIAQKPQNFVHCTEIHRELSETVLHALDQLDAESDGVTRIRP